MKPVTPSSITSGTEPRLNATTGVPQAIASIIIRPNGSGQSIGNSSAFAPDRNAGFCASLISPMNSTCGVEQRLDHFLEVVGVGLVDLRGDLQRQPALRGDPDRGVDALSGQIRPRNARYSGFTPGCGVSSVSGSP